MLVLVLSQIANATEEFFVRKSPLYEVVGQLGMWGTLINGIQAASSRPLLLSLNRDFKVLIDVEEQFLKPSGPFVPVEGIGLHKNTSD